jgi:hypothetical protein
MLADPGLDHMQKIQVMQHIAARAEDIFLP